MSQGKIAFLSQEAFAFQSDFFSTSDRILKVGRQLAFYARD